MVTKLAASRLLAGVGPLALGLGLVSGVAHAQTAPGATQTVPAQADPLNSGVPGSGPLEGQPPEANADGDNAPAQDIVVTGSRIPSPNLSSTSPVTVLSNREFKVTGTTRVEDLVNSLPQVFAGQTGTISNGATGTATADLRGLGAARTLVLINGRRLVPGDPSVPFADLNFIPAQLVKRADILTGGASSVYGADAVAGVVNFVMDTDFKGVRLDGQYSFYQHENGTRQGLIPALDRRGFGYPSGNVADGGAVNVTGAIGAGFDDDRGHVMGYVGYRQINAVTQDRRDYSACASQARNPAQVAADPARIFDCGGSATSANGTFFDWASNTYQIGANRTFIGGSTPFNFAPTNYYQRPDERYTAGFFAKYSISDAFEPYLEAMFMDDRSVAQIAPSGNFGNTTSINCDNPLLSAQQLAIVCAPGNLVTRVTETGFALVDDGAPPLAFTDAATGAQYFRGFLQPLRRNVEGGPRRDDLQHTSYRIVGGMRGKISTAFNYDAYYQYGRTNFAETYFNDFSITRLGRAQDVVAGPDGTPICRSVRDRSDPLCVPYDLFALNSVSQDAINYLQVPGFQRGQTTEQVAQLSLSGALGEYGIGTPWSDQGIGFAIGYEFRRETLNLDTDLAFSTGDLAGQGAATLPVNGRFDVNELFAEVRVPLVQDSFFRDLSLEGGYRYSSYKTSAGTSFKTDTYKAAVNFSPIRDITLRAAYNRAVRAPNIQELFAPQRVALNGSSDPCTGADPEATQAQCALTGVTAAQYGSLAGNPAGQYNGFIGGVATLQPEIADSYTAGVVLQPTFLPGFALTVDYFNIKVKDVIQNVGQDTIISQCIETGNPTFCNLIRRDSVGSLWRSPQGFVVDLPGNLGSLKTSGIDVNGSYGREIGSLGTLNLSFVGTWLNDLTTDNGISTPYDCVGFYGLQCGTPTPEWRHQARISFTLPDGVGLSGRWRHFNPVRVDRRSDNPTLNAPGFAPVNARIPSQDYFDLTLTATVGTNYTFQLGVQNLLDREPPIIGANGASGVINACAAVSCNGNTYPGVYDALGRYIFTGVTLNF